MIALIESGRMPALRSGSERPASTSDAEAGSMFQVSGLISANTGVAPALRIADAVAKNVNGVVSTASPGPMPSARSESQRASVPLDTPTA
jgi:hypothetical protein